MTIRELLTKIAQTDELPNRWRVQVQRAWTLDGAAEPEELSEAVLEYRMDDALIGAPWARFGRIETSEPLVHTRDWIEKIIVAREVPSAVVLPFQVAVGSLHGRMLLELEPDPAADIPF